MGTIAFSNYIASRPDAAAPVKSTDRVLILQGGAVKLIASDDIGGGLVSTVLIDSSITPTTLLPKSGEIVYAKTNDSLVPCGFDVSVAGQTMCQELINGLSIAGESIRVKLIGVHWYKIA